ncbi:MAG: pilus assembly protein [Lachnospiraceae bacterium]|jgi:predicted GNAT family acetyltransferase|nr:pilus assembly protein [Lachnospiraceae bacterium]
MRKSYQGSLTVEMSYLMPIIILLIIACINVCFYFHDKGVLHAAAYETISVGRNKMRTNDKISEGRLESFFAERVRGKCLYLTSVSKNISISDTKINIQVNGKGKGLKVSIVKTIPLDDPEKFVRTMKMGKDKILDGN